MSIDPVVRLLQGTDPDHPNRVFDDDLCLIADRPGDLQRAICSARDGLNRLGLFLKTFFYSSTTHLQRMGTYPKTEWARMDRIFRPEIQPTLYLPQEASGEYLYGSTSWGSCGIRLLA